MDSGCHKSGNLDRKALSYANEEMRSNSCCHSAAFDSDVDQWRRRIFGRPGAVVKFAAFSSYVLETGELFKASSLNI